LEAPADGYTIFAGTASLIAQVIATQKDVNKNIWGFQWISMLMRDPECVITSKKASVNNWLDVVKDAKAESKYGSGRLPVERII
jgi:putative tricarboxylic transport membrane protein